MGSAKDPDGGRDGILVDAQTLQATGRCRKDFLCLVQGPYCRIVACLDERVHFICGSAIGCGYRVPFAGRQTCGCPTRQEIYRRYKR